MRKKLFKLAAILLIIGIAVLGISFFFFHFVTDDGITLIWHEEAGKPFVTMLIGVFGAALIAESLTAFLCALIITEKED
jgi:multisubunit Na+/H+ antiporter MnhB subunit